MDAWNPDQYERFKAERSRPFFDLLDLVHPKAGMRVIDLGCGTGELTADLHRRLQAVETIGVERSEAMLVRAAAHSGGGLRFELGDLSRWVPAFVPDLIFSNAALQWVGDHPALLARLTTSLAPNGQLAVQMPANHDYPSHIVAREVADEEPFRSHLGSRPRRPFPLSAEEYATLLDGLGYRGQLVRLHVYAHHLDGPEQVVEWVKGTLLTEYEADLSADLFALFLERYRERLLQRLPDRRPFFYPFKRLLMWAQR